MAEFKGKSSGFLLGLIEGLACEYPRFERELKSCASAIRQKSVRSSDYTTRRVYKEVLNGYATVEEIAKQTRLAQITVYVHLRKLLRKKLIVRAHRPREKGRARPGGDQRSYLYLAV